MFKEKWMKMIPFLLVLVMLVVPVLQPISADAAGKDRTFNTELGKVTIKGTPKRIVSLSMAGTDAVVALGLKPVGYTISNSKTVPTYLRNKLKGSESVGSLSAPSLERIAALKPDLIIVDHVFEFHKEIIPKLQKIAPVVGFRANNYKESMSQLVLMGDILGRKAKAKAFVSKFNKDLKAAQASVKDKNVSVLGFFVNKNGINVWQDNSFSGSILTALKADYAYKKSGTEYTDFETLSLEKILQLNPDLLIAYVDPGSKDLKNVKSNPIWPKLKAVKAKKVVQVNRDLWSRSRGPLAAQLVVKEAASILKRY